MYALECREVIVNKVKPTGERFMLRVLNENYRYNNLITKIVDIIYTKGEQKLKRLIPITKHLFHNLMIVKIADFKTSKKVLNGKFLVEEKI